jgi:hypothetical protein
MQSLDLEKGPPLVRCGGRRAKPSRADSRSSGAFLPHKKIEDLWGRLEQLNHSLPRVCD